MTKSHPYINNQIPALSLSCFISHIQTTQHSCSVETIAHWQSSIFQPWTPNHCMTQAKPVPSFVPLAFFQATTDLNDFPCTVPSYAAAGHSKVCHIRHSSPRRPESNGALMPKEDFCFYPFPHFVLALMSHLSLKCFLFTNTAGKNGTLKMSSSSAMFTS